jgi:VWFA-related protein
VVLAAGLCLGQGQPAPPKDELRISASVDRVVLPVTVVDGRDRIVANLTKDNFRIYDEGRLEAIHDFSQRDIPLTVGLVVDSSTSMRPKREHAILAALSFVRLSNPEDEAFVVNFNERVSFGLRQPFSADPDQLRAAFLKVPCEGRTALYDAVVAATEHLALGTRDKKALILVSDGGDNSSRHDLRQALEAIQRSEAIVYTIGLYDDQDPERNPGVLRQLARASGGEAFFPQRSTELPDILAHIAELLRSQYTITFAPVNDGRDDRYRHVRVIATPLGRRHQLVRGLVVRTRAGYYAPKIENVAEGAGR